MGSLQVLLANVEPDVGRVLSYMSGHGPLTVGADLEIVQAYDASAGVDLLRTSQAPFDLALVEWGPSLPPGAFPLELSAEGRLEPFVAAARGRGTAVAVLTSYLVFEDSEERALGTGAIAFVPMPFARQSLAPVVSQVLDGV